MIRASALLVSALLLTGTPAAAFAQQQTAAPTSPAAADSPERPDRVQIETSLRLERRLLSLDIVAYNEARGREQRARDQMTEVADRVDQALAGDTLTLGGLETMRDELTAGRAALAIAGERVDEGLRQLQDRLRRIGFLESELTGRRPEAPRDPVTGRWRVVFQPENLAGTFDLVLDTTRTVVTGSYRLDNGAAGSFRGTFAENNLRLERVDARRGFDRVFLGVVGTGRIDGTWTANELAVGEAAQGQWTALRQER